MHPQLKMKIQQQQQQKAIHKLGPRNGKCNKGIIDTIQKLTVRSYKVESEELNIPWRERSIIQVIAQAYTVAVKG